MKKTLLVLSLFLVIFSCATIKTSKKMTVIQDDIPLVQREFRAAWVATVANIDWPSEPGLPVEQQKQEAIAILDTLQNLNMNAVVFQVRPHCDAFYPSELEPWSYYLTAEQGRAPEPFYDPLKFWIREAHARGLELHAWFNPYRAHHPKGGEVTDHSIVNKKPALAKELKNGYYWLDPAKEGTQQHSIDVVMDVLKRYDVDGIHFDDYFYPYPSFNGDKDFPYEDTWQAYLQTGGKLSRGDWRRDGVNRFINKLYQAIKQAKPWVKFGISPFGIYRPGRPASIAGFDQFEVLYADALLWYKEGWLDYFTPQLYWPINRIDQSYPVLLGYWNRENVKNRNLWPGLYTSKVKDSVGVDENINQIMITRGIVHEKPGHVHFSVKALLDSTALLNKALLDGPYREQALVPSSPWLDDSPPEMPQVTVTNKNDTLLVQWTHLNKNDVFQWIVYYQQGTSWKYRILNYAEKEIRIPVNTKVFNRDSKETETEWVTRVAVSAVDRVSNESARAVIQNIGK